MTIRIVTEARWQVKDLVGTGRSEHRRRPIA